MEYIFEVELPEWATPQEAEFILSDMQQKWLEATGWAPFTLEVESCIGSPDER